MLFRGIKVAIPNLIAQSSRGVYVNTECGKRLLDFTSGIGVTNLGHSHPVVVEAMKSACEKVVHSQMSIMKHRQMMTLMENLSGLEISKKAKFDSFYLWTSGTESVEGACKLARQITGRPNIIAMTGGYHGRTYLSMALTSSGTKYKSGFGPLPSGVFYAPFPSCPLPKSQGESKLSINDNYWGYTSKTEMDLRTKYCLSELEKMFQTNTSPKDTAAIVIEPIQGESGYHPAPPGFLSGLRQICDKHEILLICDEVQSGFGRSGSMFVSEWMDGGITPDIMTMAKGIANGLPLSVVATRRELSDKQEPGTMGGTFGGNAVACAAANAVFEVFRTEKILENTMEREKQIRAFFHQNIFPGIKEIRGRGLMLGVELHNKEKANKIVDDCLSEGLMLLTSGPNNTIRLIPALNISKEDLALGLNIIGGALSR
jgi:4-aminobutyrate aminotransferase